MGIGQRYNESVLAHAHDQKLILGEPQDHELNSFHILEGKPNLEHLDQWNDYSITTDVNGNINDIDHELALIAQRPDLGFSEKQGLEVVQNNQLESHPELLIDQDQKMDESSQAMVVHEPVLTVNPISQAGALVVTPDHELTVGREFSDIVSCRRALRDAAIALHFEMRTVKSDTTRYTARCASEGCPWRIHTARLPGVPTFSIRTIHGEHTCGGISHVGHNQASVQWIANNMEQRIRENPDCRPKDLLEEIHRLHGITLSYKKAWRGKERVMASLRESFKEDYRLLPQYCDQVKMTNKGSIASVYADPNDGCFRRLFISFQASIFGFTNACRPLLGLDAIALKSKYLGALLFATSVDGDGALFPLAFGIVDKENDENWAWFLHELHSLLETNTENMPQLTILSDRRKGIVDAVETKFPTAFHGFCMHRLCDSFQKEFNNTTLVNLFWEAAHALTVIEFEAKMIEIENISQQSAQWIRSVPPRLWANAYFEGTRFGHMTLNIIESFSSWILEASGLPIVQMMESIRRKIMTWFSERHEISMQWNSFVVPSAERYISQALKLAESYQIFHANEAEFEVISHEGTYLVDIKTRCCMCRGWQIYGLPCTHAVAALLSCRQNVELFTESCFTVEAYRKTYSEAIHPIPDKSLWKELSQDGEKSTVEVVVNPPKLPVKLGKPRKKRAREDDSGRVKRVVHCSRCNQPGHFRTTCATPM